jgi:hypothetical protein
MTLISTEKLMTSNIVQFTVQFYPAIPALKSTNFSQVFSVNLTGTNLSYSYNDNGTLTVDAAYNSTIQGENATLLFNPIASNSPLFASTPPSQIDFAVDPDNNIAAVYYDNTTYSNVKVFDALAQTLMYASLAGFVAGLVLGKFIGVEMIGVVQVAYIGLMIINYLQPMMSTLAKIGFVNGINTLFQNSTDVTSGQLPHRVTSLQYEAEMAYNMNYTTILLLLPPLVSLILFILSKIIKSKAGQLSRYSMLALCEYGLTAVMFVMYQMMVSLLVYALNAHGTSSLLPFSVGEAFFTVGIAIAIAVLYNIKP